MPTKTYKEPRQCICGYATTDPGNWCRHGKTCKSDSSPLTNEKDARIASLESQLAAKDEQMAAREKDKDQLITQLATKDEQMARDKQDLKEQLAAKDRQIDELIKAAKKPKTIHNTTNNKYVVEQHVNCFGKESVEHISEQQIQRLLADPANAVPQYIKLKHQRAPGGVNKNVRIPNQKRAMYQVVVPGPEGEKEWEHQAKGDVLEQLYDENSIQLEAEVDEDTRVGSMFLNHQDKVRESANGNSGDGGKRYSEQLNKIHCVLSQ